MSKKVLDQPRHLNVFIEKDVHDALIHIAAKRQMLNDRCCSVSELVREALEKLIKGENK